ncbi:MAG: four helix bundle protein [Prosthecobacter sp.]|uniref:four helix bundle protein n=1 Tax=Prosthecobacter sp. TaxID=1965333 RepID=UPI003901BB4C
MAGSPLQITFASFSSPVVLFYELRTQAEIARRLAFVSQEAFQAGESLIIEIERMLTSLITKLRSHV